MELYGSEEGQHVLPTRLPQNGQGRRENSDSGEKPVSSESAGEEAISALERHLLKIVLTDASYYHKVAVYSYIFQLGFGTIRLPLFGKPFGASIGKKQTFQGMTYGNSWSRKNRRHLMI